MVADEPGMAGFAGGAGLATGGLGFGLGLAAGETADAVEAGALGSGAFGAGVVGGTGGVVGRAGGTTGALGRCGAGAVARLDVNHGINAISTRPRHTSSHAQRCFHALDCRGPANFLG